MDIIALAKIFLNLNTYTIHNHLMDLKTQLSNYHILNIHLPNYNYLLLLFC